MPPAKEDAPTIPEASQSTDELAKRVRDLENALAATRAGLPLTQVPHHGAGPGSEVAETWSQAEQEAARAAE